VLSPTSELAAAAVTPDNVFLVAAAAATALVLLQLAVWLRAAAAGRMLLLLLQLRVPLLPAADLPAGAHAAEHLRKQGDAAKGQLLQWNMCGFSAGAVLWELLLVCQR
jgi:hypothetical protein